jgi:predicted DCC family thiol-disulfide oxidoreductase YuxK
VSDHQTVQTSEGHAAELLPDRPVLLYDHTCRFCRAMAELATRWDRRERLAFLPWSHEIAEAWIADLPPEVRDTSMHFKLRNGRLISGNGTFAILLSFLPGTRWLGRLGRRNRAVGWLLGNIYSLTARNRERLSPLVPYRELVVVEPELR